MRIGKVDGVGKIGVWGPNICAPKKKVRIFKLVLTKKWRSPTTIKRGLNNENLPKKFSL